MIVSACVAGASRVGASVLGACEQEAVCPTRINWNRISHEVERALERVPISEMVSGSAPTGLLSLEGAGDGEQH